MKSKHVLGLWIICLAFTQSAAAQPILTWKLEKGQVLEVERVATQKQTVTLKKKEITEERTSKWNLQLDVKDVQGSSFAVLATLTKVEHRFAGIKDTELLDPKLAEKMQGATFTVIVAATGDIIELRGYEDFLTRLAGKDKERLRSLRTTFPEATLKDAFADIFGPLPRKKGGWERKWVEPIPHFGTLTSIARLKSGKVDKPREFLQYSIETKFDPVKDDPGAFFRVVDGSVKNDKSTGEFIFDRSTGCLTEHTRTVRLQGTLTIEIMQRRESVKFTSESDVKINVKVKK